MSFQNTIIALDWLPEGWVKTFVPKLKEELFETIGIFADDFEVMDAKEKYGQLRLYWTWQDRVYTEHEIKRMNILYDYIDAVISKYEDVSKSTCMDCGCETTSGVLCSECNKNHKETS